MPEEFKVVFSGKALDGFDLPVVREEAIRRLKLSPEMGARLFSGRAAIIKKGVPQALAERYQSELRKIGMEVHIEALAAAAPPPPPPPDLEKTHMADPAILASYLNGDEAGAAPVPMSLPPTTRQRENVPPSQVATLVANPAALAAYFDSASEFTPSSPAPVTTPATSRPLVPEASPAMQEASPVQAETVPQAAIGPFGGQLASSGSLAVSADDHGADITRKASTHRLALIGLGLAGILGALWWVTA